MTWELDRLVEQIEMVYTGTLVGGAAQTINTRFEMMTRIPPRPGDLVLMMHAGIHLNSMNRLGWLLKVEDIPVGGEWPEDERRPVFRHWTIRKMDGSEIRWTNVQVIRVIRESTLGQYEVVHDDSVPSERGES